MGSFCSGPLPGKPAERLSIYINADDQGMALGQRAP